MSENSDVVKLRLTLDVTYDLQGVGTEEMQARLHAMVQNAVSEGMLTGDTPAEVEAWETHVTEVPLADEEEDELTEEEIATYLQEQIEGGHISPEKMAMLMTRYGLARPEDFAAEMQERIAANEAS